MAKKRQGPNKSEAIRTFYENNPNAKPRAVVEALAAEGLEVSAQFVSTIRSKQLATGGKTTKRAGRPKKVATKRVTKRASKRGRPAKSVIPAAGTAQLSLDELLKAKELIEEMGGIERARASLDALDQLSS
ncbi:hypothetical protein FF011L_13010 [Roseimaritima multifibrata]|uniref:Uncharacterized protein n=1 Tax=Roseimaritima multifibrata TaxID=1930274 RepID=A0A517MCD5_9BACT|nr:hypothetical protein [Roseimaritima multifibrata]QDS92554.1 hypothetical protein FF011L_13010 [Roseimaritima multifibrata]